MSILVKDLAFVGHPVTDVARARNFYEKNLGLKPMTIMSLEDGKWWIEYEFSSGTLAISNLWPPSGNGGATTALEVANIDDALAHFRSHAVTVVFEIIDTPVCRLFGIKDPDGNDITIHQHKTLKA
jgi:predicted enzyme related to lactoylglutathione lyase